MLLPDELLQLLSAPPGILIVVRDCPADAADAVVVDAGGKQVEVLIRDSLKKIKSEGRKLCVGIGSVSGERVFKDCEEYY